MDNILAIGISPFLMNVCACIIVIFINNQLVRFGGDLSVGANKQQTLKALKEAEAYKGPSLIIAYAPCINQGIRKGMGKSMEEGKLAVQAGYWMLYRFNPELAKEGKNPFQLDSKEPTGDLNEFLSGENRYASLAKKNPEMSKSSNLYKR